MVYLHYLFLLKPLQLQFHQFALADFAPQFTVYNACNLTNKNWEKHIVFQLENNSTGVKTVFVQ